MDLIQTLSGDAATLAAPNNADVNYYRVLDVSPTATRMELREAYLRLKMTYNSGSAALYSLISEDEAREQMAAVDEAFRILNDDVSRHEFDKRIGVERSREGREHRGAPSLGDFVTQPPASSAPVAKTPHWTDSDPNAGTVRTARSSLPIIKLRAKRAGSEDMQRQMMELIETSDAGDGDLFRRLRLLCEVSEDEMQERTKICVSYIQAIEVNRFERLPQAVYVKGFLRSYFRYMCVPEAEKMVAAFSARLQDWQANKKS